MEEVNPEAWNKKRIFIAVFLLTLLAFGGYLLKTRVLGVNSLQPEKTVRGISVKEKNTEPELKLNVQEAVKKKIDNLKQEVASLDLLEIASSSPQVQKILRDIKSLEQYPISQIQEICRKVCGL